MIYLIFGENAFLSREKLKDIIDKEKKTLKEGLAISEFSGKDFDFVDFRNELLLESIFQQKKLIILRNAFSNREFKEKFLKEAKELIKQDKIIIFFEEGKIKAGDSLHRFIKKHGRVYELKLPSPREVRKIIKERLLENGYKIELRALDMLGEFVGNDIWRLSYELQKLMAYKYKERVIKERDVHLLVRPRIDVNIFKTIDAIAKKDKKKALDSVYGHLKKGDSPLYILAMINFQFRNLLIVKEKESTLEQNVTSAQLRQTLKGIHPFVLEKSFRQAKKFSLKQLKGIYKKIFQVDLAIKTGKLRPVEGLELLILDL